MRSGFEKRFETGDIVYWCHRRGHNYEVHYGMVDEQFSDAVCIDYLAPRERRLVNDVPIEQFENEDRYKKLPHSWTYNTVLYKISYRPLLKEEAEYNLDLTDPESIKTAYKKGYFVKDSTIFHGIIEDEVTKKGYRIVKKYPSYMHHIDHVSIRPDKVYFTYDEAKREVDENNAEFQRQASLSDYDWSVEQIDRVLAQWKAAYCISEDEVNNYKNWLLGLGSIEDLEVRLFGGNIQWKYWKNKRWNHIELGGQY